MRSMAKQQAVVKNTLLLLWLLSSHRASGFPFSWSALVIGTTWLHVATSASTASSSSQPYNAYNYDLTTPMFTPDGRLLQVEYAGNAPRNSSPMVGVSFTDENNESAIVVANLLSSSSRDDEYSTTTTTTTTTTTATDDNDKSRTIQRRKYRIRTRAQRRIVNIPSTNGGDSTGGGLVLGLTGILPDNVALLQEVRQHMESWHRQYGLYRPHPQPHDTSTITATSLASLAAFRVAHVIGDACQMHSFGGGIRPFGAAVLVCGVDPIISTSTTTPSSLVMYTTYPSGSVVKHTNSGSRNNKTKPIVVVLGGEQSLQHKISKRIHETLASVASSAETSTTSLKHAVTAVLQSLLEEQRRSQSSLLLDASTATNTKGNSNEDDDDDDVDDEPLFEVAVITQRAGVHYLDEADISKIIRQSPFS